MVFSSCSVLLNCILLFPLSAQAYNLDALTPLVPQAAQLWRLVDLCSGPTSWCQWIVHEIQFYEDFIVDQSDGSPRCVGPINPRNKTNLHVVSSGVHCYMYCGNFPDEKQNLPEHAFDGHLPKTWISQLYGAQGGQSAMGAWIGLDFNFSNVNVKCIQIYQTHRTKEGEGKERFALESERVSGAEWQQEAEWSFDWPKVPGENSVSLWMTFAVGERPSSAYTECGGLDNNCCVWPSIPQPQAVESSAFGISNSNWHFQMGGQEPDRKCTLGATVKNGTRCAVSINRCQGFEGFFTCVNGAVLIESTQSWDRMSQAECSAELDMSLKSGSRLMMNDDGHVIIASYDDNGISEHVGQEEEEDSFFPSNMKFLIMCGVSAFVLVLVGAVGVTVGRKLQNPNPLKRFHDEPEVVQTEKAVTVGCQSHSTCTPEDLVVDIR